MSPSWEEVLICLRIGRGEGLGQAGSLSKTNGIKFNETKYLILQFDHNYPMQCNRLGAVAGKLCGGKGLRGVIRCLAEHEPEVSPGDQKGL